MKDSKVDHGTSSARWHLASREKTGDRRGRETAQVWSGAGRMVKNAFLGRPRVADQIDVLRAVLGQERNVHKLKAVERQGTCRLLVVKGKKMLQIFPTGCVFFNKFLFGYIFLMFPVFYHEYHHQLKYGRTFLLQLVSLWD